MSSINSIFSTLGSYFSRETTLSSQALEQERASTAGGIVPAAEEAVVDWVPERPLITSPKDLPLSRHASSDYRLLAVTEETRHLGDEILKTLSSRLNCAKEKIAEVSAENIQKLKEAAERANASNFWSILKKIATSLLSAISIVFGITMLASGGSALIGGAMIASGILSLANFALSELGTWDWIADQLAHDNEDLKKKIAMIMPAAVGILAGGIGLLGSVNAIASNAMNFAEKAVSVAQTALSIFNAVTTLGKGISDARLLWTQADLSLIQGELTVQRENFDTLIDEIKSSMNEFKAVQSKTKKAVEMVTESDVQLVR